MSSSGTRSSNSTTEAAAADEVVAAGCKNFNFNIRGIVPLQSTRQTAKRGLSMANYQLPAAPMPLAFTRANVECLYARHSLH